MGKTIFPNLGRVECVTVNELLRYCNICCPWLNEQKKEMKMRTTAIRNQFKEEGPYKGVHAYSSPSPVKETPSTHPYLNSWSHGHH